VSKRNCYIYANAEIMQAKVALRVRHAARNRVKSRERVGRYYTIAVKRDVQRKTDGVPFGRSGRRWGEKRKKYREKEDKLHTTGICLFLCSSKENRIKECDSRKKKKRGTKPKSLGRRGGNLSTARKNSA